MIALFYIPLLILFVNMLGLGFWSLVIPAVIALIFKIIYVEHFKPTSQNRKHIKTGRCSYENYENDNDYNAYWKAPHNGRYYEPGEDCPRSNDGSPDMRYSENYRHADED